MIIGGFQGDRHKTSAPVGPIPSGFLADRQETSAPASTPFPGGLHNGLHEDLDPL